jgi:hypothetical protein
MGKAVLSRAQKLIRLVNGLAASLVFAAGPAFAGFEPSVEIGARSYPLSGALNVDLAYSIPVWGEAGFGEPWFGYIQPSITGTTAGSYNSGKAELALFPISFLGVAGGAEAINNGQDYKAYDCDAYNCRGKFWRAYASTTLGLAAGPVFLVGKGKIERLHQDPDQTIDTGLDFIEPTSGLAAHKDGDLLYTAGGMLGCKIGEAWRIAYAYSWSRMQEVAGQSQTNLGLVVWDTGTWQIAAGLGTFHSELKDKEATGIVRIQWQPLPRLGLL